MREVLGPSSSTDPSLKIVGPTQGRMRAGYERKHIEAKTVEQGEKYTKK